MMAGLFCRHPGVQLAYFALGLGLTMAVRHPLVCGLSLAGAVLALLCRQGSCTLAPLWQALATVILLGLANGLLQPAGSTVLFTLWRGRPVTWEAISWGLTTGAMLAAVVLWFSCLSWQMDMGALTALLGTKLPGLCLLLSMILGFLPRFSRTFHQLSQAQMALSGGEKPTLAQRGRILGAFFSLSLEEGVITTAAMKSRGHGLSRRTSYRRCPFTLWDGGCLLALAGLAAAAILGLWGREVSWYPALQIPKLPVGAVAALWLYFFLPAAGWAFGGIKWRILQSNI